jgi:hypothetical protein
MKTKTTLAHATTFDHQCNLEVFIDMEHFGCNNVAREFCCTLDVKEGEFKREHTNKYDTLTEAMNEYRFWVNRYEINASNSESKE